MSNKPKIAFLGNNITPGGGSASLYLLVKSINSDAFDKYLYASTCKSEEMKKNFLRHCKKVTIVNLKEVCSCQTFDTPDRDLKKIKITSDQLCKQFLNLLIEEKIDILHVNNSVFSHVTEYVKKNSTIKIISHVRELIDHNGINELQKFIIDRITNFSDVILTISNNEAAIFRQKNIIVLPNPYDFSNLESLKADYRTKNNIPEQTVLVAMMGRFNFHKGHLEFLKALKIIVDKKLTDKKFKFIIIGAAMKQPTWKTFAKKILGRFDYPNVVKKFIEQNDLQHDLTLIPYTQNVLQIVKDMDIMVRPSLNGDPWGRDIIEAMALSRPVVATGISDFYVKDGVNGFLVPPQKPDELANKIIYLMNNDGQRKKFGENGYDLVKQMCDLKTYGFEVEKIYSKILSN